MYSVVDGQIVQSQELTISKEEAIVIQGMLNEKIIALENTKNTIVNNLEALNSRLESLTAAIEECPPIQQLTQE